jgi:uncharacterized protein
MANPFVHLELNTTDLAKAKEFYGKLFGWTFNDTPFPGGVYATFKPDKDPGGGMMSMNDAPTGWLAYVGVEDIKAASKKAKELGAQVPIEAQEIPNVGWFSVAIDPTGARIALFQPKM